MLTDASAVPALTDYNAQGSPRNAATPGATSCNCYQMQPELGANKTHDIPFTAAAPRRKLTNYAIIFARGEVAEWSKAPDSKSGIRQRIVGSNPTLSASKLNGI